MRALQGGGASVEKSKASKPKLPTIQSSESLLGMDRQDSGGGCMIFHPLAHRPAMPVKQELSNVHRDAFEHVHRVLKHDSGKIPFRSVPWTRR